MSEAEAHREDDQLDPRHEDDGDEVCYVCDRLQVAHRACILSLCASCSITI